MGLIWFPCGLFAFLAVMISSTSGLLVNGPCPDLQSQANFKMDQYLGQWYHQEEFPNHYEPGKPCSTVTYSLQDDGTLRMDVSDDSSAESGKMVVPDPSKPADILYYPSEPGHLHTLPVAFFVADTDYKNYAVEFACMELDDGYSLQLAFMMTRERSGASDNLISALKARLQSKGVDITLFHHLDQSNCDKS